MPQIFHKKNLDKLWGHPFSTYAKFPEKLCFLPHDTHTHLHLSGGKK